MGQADPSWDRFLLPSIGKSFRTPFASSFAGQVVCIAGGAGYIGSALVKALAVEDVRSVVVLDSSERALFEIQRELAAVPCQFILGDITHSSLIHSVFRRFQPRILFHAAAFKHVGLLEHNPFAAIKNNALGTYNLLRVAEEHGIARFVLVSTDKAVNPHSVMGVSKRIAELFTLSFSNPAFQACAIRLANVIGSTGSVVPIFLSQIASRQALRVTHPQASRFFLSIEEAVTGILAAGASGCDANILLPPLSDPVLVVDLARFLLTKYAPDNKTQLCFTALGPGEKLTEDLIGKDEQAVGTLDGALTVVRSQRLSRAKAGELAAKLSRSVSSFDGNALIQNLQRIVPEYSPSNLVLRSVGSEQ